MTVAGNDVTYAACVDYNATWKYDPCLHSICLNGTCVEDELAEEGYRCQCFPGSYGDRCELGELIPARLRIYCPPRR